MIESVESNLDSIIQAVFHFKLFLLIFVTVWSTFLLFYLKQIVYRSYFSRRLTVECPHVFFLVEVLIVFQISRPSYAINHPSVCTVFPTSPKLPRSFYAFRTRECQWRSSKRKFNKDLQCLFTGQLLPSITSWRVISLILQFSNLSSAIFWSTFFQRIWKSRWRVWIFFTDVFSSQESTSVWPLYE